MTFDQLGIIDPILKALQKEGYSRPTPIQEQAIPLLLDGKDLLGCAQTGTGKTAAFAVPIIQHLYETKVRRKGTRPVRALIVAPTRELAIQIHDSFQAYGRFTGLRSVVVYGGVKQGKQVQALQNGADILVATPGRLLDLIGQGYISLDEVTHSVLDEADHMLDMGFIHDIKRIVRLLPEDRQSLFFSATMSKEIESLSRKILGQPARITIRPDQPTAERVDQALYYVSKRDKRKLLLHLLEEEHIESLLVFSRTKHGANKIVKVLDKAGIKAAAIHGNKSQTNRQKSLNAFKDGDIHVLVATDIAARGIDVDELSHVLNYDLPNVPETYVHRIGRTGRAKASGIALSFCDGEERAYLRDIQKLIDQRIPVIEGHPYEDDGTVPPKDTSNNNRSNHRRGKSSSKRRPKRKHQSHRS